MKKLLFILLFSFFPVFAHAQTATVQLSNDVDGNLVVSITSDRSTSTDVKTGFFYLPLVSTNPIPDNAAVASASNGYTLASTIPTKEVLFSKNPLEIKVGGTKKNETYHIRVVEVPPKNQSLAVRKFINADQTFTIKGTDIKIPTLTFSRDGSTYTISGKVDTSIFSPSELFVSAQILTTTGQNIFLFDKRNLESDGTYKFEYKTNSLSELKYQVIVSVESIFGDKGSRTESVDVKKGTVIPTDAAGIAAYEKNRSYKLLAPLPGITKILDNDLCQEAQKTNPDEICDINQFINFVLKFMIGLAAAVLVVRLILDGYNYMTSDVPFVQAKAKGGFKDASIGLLIALSSYLILNTINPRLVKNDFSIDAVSFNAESFRELGINYAANEASFEKIGPEGASCDPAVKPAKINFSGKGFQYIKSDYLPAQEKAVPTATKGSKSLMTAQAMKEGFWPVTKAWRTNNPGNIGNRDDGSTNQLASLDVGIKRQLTLLTDIVQNKEPNYKIGRVVKISPGTGDDGKKYPALNFIYDGSICQYLSIYATGARHNTSYMSLIMGYFESTGLKITPKTKLSEIYGMK